MKLIDDVKALVAGQAQAAADLKARHERRYAQLVRRADAPRNGDAEELLVLLNHLGLTLAAADADATAVVNVREAAERLRAATSYMQPFERNEITHIRSHHPLAFLGWPEGEPEPTDAEPELAFA